MTAHDDVDEVLDNIDEALRWEAQWEQHAMRWSAEPPSPGVSRTRSQRPASARWLFVRHIDDVRAPTLRDLENADVITTTVMYAFHDEDGRLVVTADPDAAAAAPGPISIGFDPAST